MEERIQYNVTTASNNSTSNDDNDDDDDDDDDDDKRYRQGNYWKLFAFQLQG